MRSARRASCAASYEMQKGQFHEEIAPLPAERRSDRAKEIESRNALPVESCQQTAAKGHHQKPIRGIDGEEIGATALSNVLGKERRRHKSKPTDHAELCARSVSHGSRKCYNVRQDIRQKQAGDKREDHRHGAVLRLVGL